MRYVAVAMCALVAIIGGAVTTLTVGWFVGALVLVASVAGCVWIAGSCPAQLLRNMTLALAGVAVIAAAVLVWGLAVFDGAWSTTDGAADPADPVTLASAQERVEAAAGASGFRLILSTAELQAILQNDLVERSTAAKNIEVGIVPPVGDAPPRLDLTVDFKGSDSQAKALADIENVRGRPRVSLVSGQLGLFKLPPLVGGGVDQRARTVVDLTGALKLSDAQVEVIQLSPEGIMLIGNRTTGRAVSSPVLLDAIAASRSQIGGIPVPEDLIEPGTVDGIEAEGETYYVAVGDSAAANDGVDDVRLGYVSRLHRALEDLDAAEYGLRNFAVPGETSGSLVNGGQLEAAIEFITDHDVAYITIGVGIGDVAGHLGSDDCTVNVYDEPCQQRLRAALAGYEENLTAIAERITEAAPGAKVIFLTPYNPFNFGFPDSEFSDVTTTVFRDFNAVAWSLLPDLGIGIADGFITMGPTTGVTTHIFDEMPSAAPNPIGHNLLAQALIGAARRLGS